MNEREKSAPSWAPVWRKRTGPSLNPSSFTKERRACPPSLPREGRGEKGEGMNFPPFSAKEKKEGERKSLISLA